MKRRRAVWLLAALLAAVPAAFAQAGFVWDYFGYGISISSSGFTVNGDGTFASSSGGAAIWQNTVTGANPNDYEMNTTLTPNSPGGTYMHFLRASLNALPGSGSYISVEISVPSGWKSGGPATLAVRQCSNGTVTQLDGASISLHTGDTLRSVVWGTNLWVFLNNIQQGAYTIPLTTGQPGYGGYNIPSDSGFAIPYQGSIKIGHHDTVAPQTVIPTSVATSLLPNSASLKWQGVADDPVGIGVFQYMVTRNGSPMTTISEPEYADATVQPSTTYTYSIQAVDFHGNTGAANTITITTPPAGSIDPRRVGLYSTGSYWGGGGEQIDTLSGNLHFTMPFAKPQGRTGWTVPVNLVYDSQNWRQDNGVNWNLGRDVGYGFGWRLLIGSVTPYYASYYGAADHYVYTDATGAEYRLDYNAQNSGVWTSSTQGVYVWLDTTVSPNRLHFSDGKFWVLGSTSGGTEADAGTMYPTIIEDTVGNQVIVTYDTGVGLPFSTGGGYPYWHTTPNTSSRIVGIEDSRAGTCGVSLQTAACTGTSGSFGLAITYAFAYDRTDYAIPHLTSYGNVIATAEAGSSFTYAAGPQEPPFGSDPEFAGATTTFLTQASIGAGGPWQFTYDSAGAGELNNVIFPFGGEIAWNYGTFTYIGGRSLREVSARYLAPDSAHATNPMWNYGISRPDAQNSVALHSAMTLTDASGIGAKTWNFTTTGSPWQIGLVSEFVQSASAGGPVLQDDVYTWSQDPAGRPYISARSTTTGQGTSNLQTAYSTQTLDQYGNIVQSVIYPYNNTTTPLQTWNNTYITNSGYVANWVFSLLKTSTITTGGSTITVVSNFYDNCAAYYCNDVYQPPQGSTPPREYDANPPVPIQYQGLLYAGTTPSRTLYHIWYPWGLSYSTSGTDGTNILNTVTSGTNYDAPTTIDAQSYNQTIGYSAWMGITQMTGANGEQLSMTYDSEGRPNTATSAYGAVTTFSYSASAPFSQTETGPSGTTITTLDGFGRAVHVQHGASATPDATTSYMDMVYAPCACSPLGKMQQVSQPYPSGGSATAWTSYRYDGLGRTLTIQQPDGVSTTAYSYAGSQSTATDPAGNWKTFTADALGNLTAVVEPDPCIPGNTFTTSYTYDWMKHVTGVTMTRPNISYSPSGVCSETGSPVTQTRTFVYNNAGQLTSAANPENGTVTYFYNSDSTLQRKHDAKGQDTVYTYDSLKRVTMIQRYPQGVGSFEDQCQRVTYTFDGNPVNPSFSQNSYGRLTTAQYGCPVSNLIGGTYWGAYSPVTFIDMYSYHPAGGITAKQLLFYSQYTDNSGTQQTGTVTLEADYAFDSAGRIATLLNPANPVGYQTGTDAAGNPIMAPYPLAYTYDPMGRPQSVANFASGLSPWVTGVQYDYASRLTSMQVLNGPSSSYLYSSYTSESRAYNANGQLTSLNWTNSGTPLGGIQYTYSATRNDGQITQAVDALSGETITYQYDALKRLISANSSPTSGSSPAPWTQNFQYDGFGNLTSKVLNGTTIAQMPVNAVTNQLTYANYDANGNMTSGAGASMTYDAANRIATASTTGGAIESFQYAPDSKRILRVLPNQERDLTFYGGQGEKLGVFILAAPTYYNGHNALWLAPQGMTLSFGGRIVEDVGPLSTYMSVSVIDHTNPLMQDRLGTNRTGGARYYPYGDEITSTTNDRVKFATYTRDSYTGLDYAAQRFYASTYGRFNTPDPDGGSAGQSDPGSWNRYSYAGGDPIGRNDPAGLDWCVVDDYAPGYQPPECGGYDPYGSDWPFPPPADYPLPQPPPIAVPISVGPGDSGTLILQPDTSQVATLDFMDAQTAGVAIGVCTLQPELCIGVATVGVGVAISVAWPQIQSLLYAITDAIQSRRLVTVQASCSVHRVGTPNHASAGTITATGQGTNYGTARAAAYSAAQAAVTAAYGVGYHAQHCGYREL